VKGTTRRTHPLQIFHSLKRVAFLLILPFLQGLLIGEGTLGQRLYGSGLNAVLVGIVVALAVLQWHFCRVSLRGNRLTVKKGFLFRSEDRLHTERIGFLSVEYTPWLSIFRAARLDLETPGGGRRRPDFSFLWRKKETEKLLETIAPREKRENLFRTPFRRIFLLAASWSDAASGLLIAVPFINQLGSVLGGDVAERIYEAADFSQWLILAGTPPLLAYLAWIFMGGWAVAFFSRLFRHGRFRAYSAGGFIVTESGVISRRRNVARRAAVNGITVQQSLPMVLLGIQAAYLQVVGYGKKRGERAFLAAGKAGEIREIIEGLAGLPKLEGRKIRPLVSCRIYYVAALLTALFAASLACALWMIFMPGVWEYVLILWGFLGALGLWRLGVCLVGFRRAGVRFSDGAVELSTHKHFSLIRGILPRHRIQEIRITQSRGQRKRGTCSLSLGIYCEGKNRIVVRGLRYREVLDCLFRQPE